MEQSKKVRYHEMDRLFLSIENIFRLSFYSLVDLKVPPSSSKRAYAFIQYENMDMAFEARKAMDGRIIGKADCKIGYGKQSSLLDISSSHCLVKISCNNG